MCKPLGFKKPKRSSLHKYSKHDRNQVSNSVRARHWKPRKSPRVTSYHFGDTEPVAGFVSLVVHTQLCSESAALTAFTWLATCPTPRAGLQNAAVYSGWSQTALWKQWSLVSLSADLPGREQVRDWGHSEATSWFSPSPQSDCGGCNEEAPPEESERHHHRAR